MKNLIELDFANKFYAWCIIKGYTMSAKHIDEFLDEHFDADKNKEL